jgi:hypothetical protein
MGMERSRKSASYNFNSCRIAAIHLVSPEPFGTAPGLALSMLLDQ